MATQARRRLTLNTVHKWAGLVAALWLAVLAITGLMQLNRGSWHWQWRSGPALDESIAAHDDKQLWRHNQVNPTLPRVRVASGAAGAFLTRDGGANWQRLRFGVDEWRNVAVLEPSGRGAGWTVWAGTNDGLWRLDVAAGRFVAEGLQGQEVNAVSIGTHSMVAAVRSSSLYARRVAGGAADWHRLDLAPLPASAGASSVDLGRWLQDIHLGRGLFGPRVDSMLWNIVALGLLGLCVTGLAYWAVMRWHNGLRRRPKETRPGPVVVRRAQRVILWSFRVHAMVVGIVLALPLLLVFLTGLYQNHRGDVQMAFRGIELPGWMLPPVYRRDDWRGQVMNVALAADAAGELLAVGNRRGMFVSRDLGRSWAREASFRGPAMRLRRIGDQLYVPGRMMRRVQVRREGRWQVLEVPRPVVMVNEMSEGPGGMIWWTRGETIFRTDGDGQMRGKMANTLPTIGYLPWASFAAELHEGALIWRHWKWIGDLVALTGIALVVTGFLRWRTRRW